MKKVSTKKTINSSKDLEIRRIRISSPERVIDETTGLTKGRLAEYYGVVAPYILRSIKNHPVTLVRCPNGIEEEIFYQRNPHRGLGPDVCPFSWHYKEKIYDYLYIKSAAGLLELVQMNTVEFYPWGTRYNKMDYPDRAIFDLDPDSEVSFDAVKRGSLELKDRLVHLGLQSFIKCTGGKGLHIVVPLAEKDSWQIVKPWCEKLADHMVSDTPSAYVATMTKAKRKGKVFIDFFRNDYTATAVADFSVRARLGTPVAVPLEWNELKKLKSPSQFTIDDVIKRINRTPPSNERYEIKQRLPKW